MIKRHIPNAITCCNLISGCVATAFAFGGQLQTALIWIVVGAVFDFFDGMSARLLGVSSPIGKELDSLADDVTFGVAPATIVFSELSILEYPAAFHAVDHIRNILPFFAFVMAAFSALRLAKFNLDERQTTSFIGLPTPANALFWGSLLVGGSQWIEKSVWSAPAILVGVLVSCWLLVSEVPMFALKFKHWGWRGNEVKYIFVLSCIPLLLIFGILGIAVIIAWYVFLSILTSRGDRHASNPSS